MVLADAGACEEGRMSGKKKTWREKLQEGKGLPKVIEIDESMRRQWGEGTIVIPAPREVDELMRKVSKGKLATVNRIREALAKRHNATIACPITTGIFARIAAEVAAEEEADGEVAITPYWRILKNGGVLNPKYPGGCEGQKERLEAEGHRVNLKGKRFVVSGYEKCIVDVEILASDKPE